MIKKYFFILFLLFGMTSYSQVPVTLTVANQSISSGVYTFDIYLTATSNVPLYLGTSDFIFSFDETQFTAPVITAVTPATTYCTFVPTVLAQAAQCQANYYNALDQSIDGSEIRVNLNLPFEPTTQTGFDENIAEIDATPLTHRLGRFQISGANTTVVSDVSIAWKTMGAGLLSQVFNFENTGSFFLVPTTLTHEIDVPVPLTCDIPFPTNNTVGSINATLRWSPQYNALKYRLRYKAVGSGAWSEANSIIAEQYIDDLFFGTQYEYQIQTQCTPTRWTDWSSNYYFTTINTPECTLPIFVSGTSVNTEITIKWRNVPSVNYFRFAYRQKAGSWSYSNISDTTITVTNLIPGAEYQYRLRSKCPSGLTGWSATESILTQNSGSCEPPELLLTSIDNISALLTWTSETGATTYRVGYRIVGSSNWSFRNVTTSSLLLEWLAYDTDYEYRVRALCPSGWTGFSPIGTFATGTTPSCTTPYLLVEDLTTTTITLNWQDMGASEYRIRFHEVGQGYINRNAGNNTSYTFDMLTPGTTYEYKVRAKCGTRWSAYTGLVSVSTPVSKPISPKTPKNEIGLVSVYPNPGNVEESVNFKNSSRERVRIILFNTSGQLVRDFFVDSFEAYSLEMKGNLVGMYSYKVEHSAFVEVGRLFIY